MAFSNPANWSIDQVSDTVKNIRYIGAAHGATGATYDTVIDFHRWLQGLADDALASGDDELDITDTNPSSRSTDNIITLINGYNIDLTASEHLYDGSIIQNDGDTIYDGIVNFGNSDVQIQIIQNGAMYSNDFWNYNIKGTATSGTNSTIVDTGASWTTDEWIGYTVVNTTQGGRGIVTTNTATTLTVDIYSDATGALITNATSDAYSIGQPLNGNSNAGISHRFMILTRDNGVDIDGRRLLGIARRYGNTYSQFQINGTARGNNVFALVDTNDLNNTTDPATVSAYTITNTEGLNLIDVDNDSSNEKYYSAWDFPFVSAGDINDLYEYTKFLTRDSSGETLYSLSGELFRGVTHSISYGSETGGISISTNDLLAYGTAISYDTEVGGPFTIGEAIHENTATPTWKARIVAIDDNGATGTIIARVETGTVTISDGFTGQSSSATANVTATPTAVSGGGLLHVLAIDDAGATGDIYFQLLNGTSPGTGLNLYFVGTDITPSTGTADATQYVTTDTASVSRPNSTPFIGQSTGSALIGAYGVGVVTTDLTNSDLLTALDGQTYQPPNNVTNTVAGLVSGEDYVIVAPWDGSTLDVNGDPAFNKAQLTLNTTLNTDYATDFSVVVSSAIPSDTPNTGTIRVINDSGFEKRLVYSSWSGSTFTIDFTQSETDIPNVADFAGVNEEDAATAGNNVYITYLDTLASGVSESYTAVFNTTRTLVALVRDGGSTPIIQFIAQWSFGSSNQTLTAIRTSDA